jgi:hypothetical protein
MPTFVAVPQGKTEVKKTGQQVRVEGRSVLVMLSR